MNKFVSICLFLCVGFSFICSCSTDKAGFPYKIPSTTKEITSANESYSTPNLLEELVNLATFPSMASKKAAAKIIQAAIVILPLKVEITE